MTAAAATPTNGAGLEQRAGGNEAGCDDDSSSGASFRERSLREIDICSALAQLFPMLHHPQPGAAPSPLPSLASLDLSHNELSDVPGLAALPSLTSLDLSRNWLRALPPECARLPSLQSLSAARNFLRPTADALLLGDPGLASLPDLASLDLRYNRKCDRQQLLDLLAKARSLYGPGALPALLHFPSLHALPSLRALSLHPLLLHSAHELRRGPWQASL